MKVFLENILFMDKATFTNHGNINLWNLHYWAPNNPHWIKEKSHQHTLCSFHPRGKFWNLIFFGFVIKKNIVRLKRIKVTLEISKPIKN